MATNAVPEPDPNALPTDPVPDKPPARKLSEELARLKERSEETSLTLHEVIAVLGGRAYTVLLVLLALPFITPIPLPGLSTPFGIAIGLIALRLTLGRKPWLPEKILKRPIPAGFFAKVFKVAAGVLRFLEKFLRPRMSFLTETAVLRRAHAALMVVAAMALLLPLPIPFTNTFPAWVIILVAAGLLERDGLFILGAYVVFAAGVLYFVFLGEAAQRAVVALKDWILSW